MKLQTTTREGLTISFLNEEEFESLWWEIFRKKTYFFHFRTDAPFIIDCGANIGMSVLYFKQCFPQARIIAFEPNPLTFQVLEQNVRQNHLRDVQLIQAALAAADGELQFFVKQNSTEASCGDTGIREAIVGSEQERRMISVPAVQLSSYITRPVDYLKMDIEGMEETVLCEIEEKLPLVTEIRLEFHCNSTNKQNNIDKTLALLSKHNFKYAIERAWKVMSIDEVKRSMEHTDYRFMIYAHRNYRRVWWQSWCMNQLFRLQNRVRRGE